VIRLQGPLRARIFNPAMRLRSIVILVVLSAIVWLGAVVPLCAALPGDDMPCCRTGAGCDLAVRASGCCRIGAAADQQTSLAPLAPSRFSSHRVHLVATALPVFLVPSPAIAILVALAGPPGFLEHRVAGPPLFLLNTSLLR
jgi:hypothetical protein